MTKRLVGLLLALVVPPSAWALQLPRAPVAAPLARARPVRLQEPPSGADELSPEQIVAAAEKASEPAWPESRPQPGVVPIAEDVANGDKFDPRFILYVSLPALVLGGQLFFTFSRDALGDNVLGPAVMDLWIP